MFLDLDGEGPIYTRIYRALRREILEGRISPGARLPATRALAESLGVSRNVVLLAYEQLLDEGYAASRVGSGTYVRSELPEKLLRTRPSGSKRTRRGGTASASLSVYGRRVGRLIEQTGITWEPRRKPLPYDFRYGRPSVSDFPYATWCRILARRARRSTTRALDYGPPEGDPALREEIARYVNRFRGVRCTAGQVLVVSGSEQAIDLAARVLVDPGTAVAIEDPHYRPARLVLAAAGARLSPVPVDHEGIRTKRLPTGARLAFVTPSHQFPTGAVLPLARRLSLLSWASRQNTFIVEDDYDSEYRYSGRPIEALQGLDRSGRVLYAGTFSKIVFPSVRIGYLIVPEPLVQPLRAAKALADTGSPTLPQLVLADFLREGHLERHLRRSRMLYAARREVLLDSVEKHLGDRVEIQASNAGLHVLLWFRNVPATDAEGLRRRAADRGVGIHPVTPFYLSPPQRAGFVLGFSSLTERDIVRGVKAIAGAL